jgi:hypothetical protein
MTYFRDIKHGEVFQMNKHDKTQWRKTTSRTARLVSNNKCFYFGKLETVERV